MVDSVEKLLRTPLRHIFGGHQTIAGCASVAPGAS
jgi:hypothetical protein